MWGLSGGIIKKTAMDLDNSKPLVIRSWPRAILHVDGDAFFVSCEQAVTPRLKGKAMVTGQERGIATAVSYEAKALGVIRGMPVFKIRRQFPQVLIVPSNYELYGIISAKMFDIVRRYTSEVEEYSIDEAFADLTGMQKPLNVSYEEIAARIKWRIETELGISVSVGVSLSKVLAKVASKFKKPSGLTMIPGQQIHHFLQQTPIGKIWGIGPNTSAYLIKQGIATAFDFAFKPFEVVKTLVSKPGQEIWHELNGVSIYPVVSAAKTSQQSISKTLTFSPPSSDRSFVYSLLIRNLESACRKAREYKLVAKEIVIMLKKQNFQVVALSLRLNRASALPQEIAPLVSNVFNEFFEPCLYRSTGVTLAGLQTGAAVQASLFENAIKADKLVRLYDFVDKVNSKYGKSVVHLLSSQEAREAK